MTEDRTFLLDCQETQVASPSQGKRFYNQLKMGLLLQALIIVRGLPAPGTE